MKKRFVIVSFNIYVALVGIFLAMAGEGLPQPKQTELGHQRVRVGPMSELQVPYSFRARFESSVDFSMHRLASLPSQFSNIPITVETLTAGIKAALPEGIASALERQKESYWISVSNEGVRIVGADERGALHGLVTLEWMSVQEKGEILQGWILDWPDHEVRALHFVQRNNSPHLVKKQIIESARYGHLNTLIISLADGIDIPSMKRLVSGDAWTKEGLLDVVNYAKENGFEVVPEIRLLTHQEKLLKDKYPELMFNERTYDPRKEETYAVVLPIIDEIINLIQPKAVHIGHDEVAGHRQKRLRKMLPPELFLKDVNRLYTHLKERGVETWMWGGMLIAPEESPGQEGLHGRHGYSSIRVKIPKDIVICDYHYISRHPEFPSALIFAREGYRVLGTTFRNKETIRNFSRYMANQPTGSMGMIATTWGRVANKDWHTVNEIITTSAEAFWNAN